MSMPRRFTRTISANCRIGSEHETSSRSRFRREQTKPGFDRELTMSAEMPRLQEELQHRAGSGLLRRRRITNWRGDGLCEVDGRQVFNFISNDYLNLASDPRVVEAARQTLAEAGVGSRAG